MRRDPCHRTTFTGSSRQVAGRQPGFTVGNSKRSTREKRRTEWHGCVLYLGCSSEGFGKTGSAIDRPETGGEYLFFQGQEPTGPGHVESVVGGDDRIPHDVE